MRIRGEIVVNLAEVASTQADVWIGIGLVDQINAGTGEDPFTHSFSDDWMWHQAIFLTQGATPQPRDSVLACARYLLDVRSKRRCDPTDNLIAKIVNAAPATLPGSIGVVVQGRLLLQETS